LCFVYQMIFVLYSICLILHNCIGIVEGAMFVFFCGQLIFSENQMLMLVCMCWNMRMFELSFSFGMLCWLYARLTGSFRVVAQFMNEL
jgi:hypothetical protein